MNFHCNASAFLRTWGIIICLCLTACADLPGTPAPTPPPPTCTSPDTSSNPYSSLLPFSTHVSTSYQQHKDNSLEIELAKQAALSELASETEHWSAYSDLVLNDNQIVRVTITFISRQLVEEIVLNDAIYNNYSTDKFDDELKNKLDQLSSRNELFFMVILTAPTYNEKAYGDNLITVNIPFKQMQLINGSDLTVTPTHDDHILNEPILITRGPVSGIIAFPISVMQGKSCIWVMDNNWNTTITLDVPSATLNQNKFDVQSWSIFYRPLVEPSKQNNVFMPTTAPNFDPTRASPLTMPPTPVWSPGTGTQNPDLETYWEDMGRYIWNRVVQNDYP